MHKYKSFYFIAEVGQNHQGDVEIFKQLIEMAAECGANAIKSAKRCVEDLPEKLKNMPYDNPNSFGRTYGEHREALELSQMDIKEVQNFTKNHGMDFGMSFTDMRSLKFINNIDVDFVKIPSSQLTNKEALKWISKNVEKPVVLSTGMSDLEQVDRAVKRLSNNALTLLQCTSAYPALEKDLNLNIIKTYLRRYNLPIGLSGHHVGIDADMVARSMGATVFERHITMSHANKGTDHAMSLEPAGLRRLIRNLDRYDGMLGTGVKKVLDCEQYALKKLRDLEYA